MGRGTNAPGRPRVLGEITVFASPHARGVMLADIAVEDLYGGFKWAALQHDDPRAIAAVAGR